MRGLFQVEGRFYTITSKILDLIVITLLWGIGCIPVVTILTSTASMYQTTVKCIRCDRGRVWDEFRDAYRKNLGQGIGLTLLFIGAGGAIALGDYYVFFCMSSRSGIGLFLVIGMVVWTALYLMNLIWIVPVFSRFQNTAGRLLGLNYVIMTRYLPRSLAMLLLMFLMAVLVTVSPPLALILPALGMLLLSYLAEPGLYRYMPEVEAGSGDWRYEIR